MNIEQAKNLMAYHDGELASDQQEALNRLIETDAQASKYLNALKRADQVVKDAFDNVLEQPVPDHLVDAIMTPTEHSKTKKDDSVTRLNRPTKVVKSRWLYATAASFVLVATFGISTLWNHTDNTLQSDFVQIRNDALESVPSGEVLESGDKVWQMMPVATYETPTRGICREYAGLNSGAQFYGIACRDSDGNWNDLLEHQFATLESNTNNQSYVPAEGQVDLINSILSELGGGRKIQYSEEEDKIQHNWQR